MHAKIDESGIFCVHLEFFTLPAVDFNGNVSSMGPGMGTQMHYYHDTSAQVHTAITSNSILQHNPRRYTVDWTLRERHILIVHASIVT